MYTIWWFEVASVITIPLGLASNPRFNNCKCSSVLYRSVIFFTIANGFVAQRFHNYMILKVWLFFDPKLNLFKSDAYIFMQQSLKKLLY